MYLVKRTRWISIAVGAITFGIVVGASLLTGAAQQPVTTQRNSPAIPEADGQVRDFQLTVGRTLWELARGKFIHAFTYNGQVPGPELRVTEGDTVRVTVKNELDEPTTVHWHGVDVPSAMDGVPDTSGPPIAPGATFIYEFVATPAGTRWYHAHFDELNQQGGGLAGALIIEPRHPPVPTTASPDRDYTLLTQEWVTTSSARTPAAPTPSANGNGMPGMS